MALRLLEIILPEGQGGETREILKREEILDLWEDRMSDARLIMRAILPAEDTEPVMDILQKRFSNLDGFRLNLLPVEASIPRPEGDQREEAPIDKAIQEKEREKRPKRVSREELYSEISDTARISGSYIAMIFLSSVVAAIGLLRDSVAVLIGAMVVAPLLGPNVALSLSTTLGDTKLGRSALKASIAGILCSLVLSFFVGLILHVDASLPEIVSRTKVGPSDIAIALAAGSAGALAFTSGLSTALIGVMVAVALLPPLVASGLLFGSGYYSMGLGALLLLMTNIICLNLAGVITFLFEGIRPRTWWEADKARKATYKAILIWSILLSILAILIVLSQRS